MKWFLILIGLVVCSSLGRSQEPTTFTSEQNQFFEKKIRPLLVQHCYKCHSETAKRIRGGLRVDGREFLIKGGDSGPAVVPGKVEKSILIKAVHYSDVNLQMPPKGKLSKKDIALLEEWVRQGVPFPDSAKVVNKTSSGIDIAKGRTFWSFQPLRQQPLPKVKRNGWARKRIDHFILAKLEKQGLSPSDEATRTHYIRRVTFDLIGLPPTPEEVDAFVADDSDDAAETLVTRLLASPHYGERWGRYWLDLVRYCDIAEPWAETKEADGYYYRDWVVSAFNRDMSYPEFVKKQMAADLMTNAEPKDLAALGFIGRSPSYWKELKLAPDVIKTVVAEEWEERIHTVGSTFLGLTVGCARCHDHKFDPITTEDYYAWAGVFANTKLVNRPLVAEQDRTRIVKARELVKVIQTKIVKLKKTPTNKKQVEQLQKELQQIKQNTPNWDAPMVPAVIDASLYVQANGPHQTKLVFKDEPRDVAIQVRGDPTNLGPIVPRRFPQVLSKGKPQPFTKGSGRLELAEAIVTDAAPLAARVIVNRVWKHHFGKGLTETPSDFGSQGERPSHPHLLDDLAFRFIKNGWSMKWLHREIVLSSTYRQTSLSKGTRQKAIDPDNRLLWRMNRTRLDVEAWRDAMLAVTGTLDKTVGGQPLELNNVKNLRRTLYGTVKRREISAILRLHDFPDPTTHSSKRVPTTTPLQQLFVLNSPFMQTQAKALAKRLKREEPKDTAARIRRAYRLLFNREPTKDELRLGTAFVNSEPNADAGWAQYAQVLLGSNEFLFVD